MMELLSPVGDFDCLKAAVQNGADAVYFGANSFSARAFAHNFNLDELKNGGKSDNIIYIDDKNFQDKLKTQTEYWEILKEEILFVRKNGAENSNIIKISEEYFDLADQTVAAVETYS